MKEEGLKREIGVRALALNAINLTIGSGIFVLPAIVYQQVGPAGIFAYLICGVTVLLVVLCYAELGSKVTTSGGGYAYVESVLGSYWGFVASLLIVIGFAAAADAAIANALVNTLAIWFNFLSEPFYRALFIILLFGFFAFINVRGVKNGIRFVEILTVAKLTPLLFIMLAGWLFLTPDNLVVQDWPSAKSIGEISLVLLFAFIGIDSSLSASGEIKNPAYTIPRGLFFGVFGVVVIYITIQIVATGVLGHELSDYPDAPLMEVANRIIGPLGITILMIGTVLSMTGTVGGDHLVSPRVLFGAARKELMPSFLAKIHPVFKTPHRSIITFSAIGCTLAVSGAFRSLAVFASTSVLCLYFLVCLATILNRVKNGKPGKGYFALPAGITIPLVAAIIVLWFLSNLARKEIFWLAGFLAMITLVYYTMRYVKSRSDRART